MAKRMTALQRQYFAPRAPAAIVVAAPRRAPARRRAAPKRRARGRRRGGGLTLGGGGILGHAMGGALYGFAVKQGWIDKLPAIPVLGRTGTAALLLNEAAKRGMMSQFTRPAANAAAVLAGYQLGNEGSIHGDDDASPDSDDGYGG